LALGAWLVLLAGAWRWRLISQPAQTAVRGAISTETRNTAWPGEVFDSGFGISAHTGLLCVQTNGDPQRT
jgi:hypothetical protein